MNIEHVISRSYSVAKWAICLSETWRDIVICRPRLMKKLILVDSLYVNLFQFFTWLTECFPIVSHGRSSSAVKKSWSINPFNFYDRRRLKPFRTCAESVTLASLFRCWEAIISAEDERCLLAVFSKTSWFAERELSLRRTCVYCSLHIVP